AAAARRTRRGTPASSGLGRFHVHGGGQAGPGYPRGRRALRGRDGGGPHGRGRHRRRHGPCVARRVRPAARARDSAEGRPLWGAWPAGVPEIWKVRTLECTRRHAGLHAATLLLYAGAADGLLVLLGELDQERNLLEICQEAVEVWQCPQELRARLPPGLAVGVLEEMKEESDASWSWATAARAVLLA
ncbi:unnamed protein product, partial [Prorocentrum cordatum]